MTISTATSDIDALLGLIQSATYSAVAEYRKTGRGVPSPDDDSPHPLDSAPDALALKKAIRVLESACERLCTTLAQPMHTIANRSMPYEAPCMRLVVEKKIPDLLEGFPEGLHIESIAAQASLDARKLKQVLRLLATRGCFKEVAENVFANNRLSLTLLSTNPVSVTVLLNTGESLKGVNSIPEAMGDPEYGASVAVNKTAFTYSVKGEMENAALFDWYRVHPETAQRFDKAMMGWSRVTGSTSVVNNFPWTTMPLGTTFCDVGSGVGTVPLAIAKAHPHISITLQDLPEPLEQAKLLWSNELPEALDAKRVEFVPINFLQQTPVAGQDVYYMKHIIHDWPDAEAITILRNVANAMKLQSRLLIHDFVLKHVFSDTSPANKTAVGLEQAPFPLLPNYGTGNIRHYNQDINMLAMFNSQERTCEEYAALGAEVGLELVQVWDFAETYMLEFRLMHS
ncbi:hypothetical protein PM082_020079 [Marasmius tenuissimus]|nr:hypothetical protein PM082_020079 [Marasmius tenuissimus]